MSIFPPKQLINLSLSSLKTHTEQATVPEDYKAGYLSKRLVLNEVEKYIGEEEQIL